jgi:hypothetical protein
LFFLSAANFNVNRIINGKGKGGSKDDLKKVPEELIAKIS